MIFSRKEAGAGTVVVKAFDKSLFALYGKFLKYGDCVFDHRAGVGVAHPACRCIPNKIMLNVAK